MLDEIEILLYILASIAVSIGLWLGSRSRAIKGIFDAHELVKILDCREGYINKIQGEIKTISPQIVAPLSKRACVGFRVIVEEYHSNGPGRGGQWEEILVEQEITSFLVCNDSDCALLLTDSSKLLLMKDIIYESGTLNDAAEHLEKFLNAREKKSTNIFGLNKTLRYKEGILEEGELTTVCGVGHWKKTSEYDLLDGIISNGKSDIFVFENTYRDRLYISDVKNLLTANELS